MSNATTTLPAVANGPPPPARVQLGGAVAMQQTIDDLNTIRHFVANEMREGLDFGVIPGTGSKPTLLQPGAQKIFMYFNCYPDHEIQAREMDGGHVEYIVKTRLISRASQDQIGSGVGSCSTMESKYRWRNAGRVCPTCGADAIIKGKAEYGGGFICFAKKGGCGAKFRDNDQAILGQAVGRAENPDIFDTRNTVLKMAKKRSQVDAAHGLGCMSELFTQDLDDYHDMTPPHREPEPPPRDEGRRAVNEDFPRRRLPPDDYEDDAGPLTWPAFAAARAKAHNDALDRVYAAEGVDEKLRHHFKVVAAQLAQVVAGKAVEKGLPAPAKKTGPWASGVADKLWRSKPAQVEAVVEAYLKGKVDEARQKFGLPDPEDAFEEGTAGEIKSEDEPVEVGAGREPGSDDDAE